MTVFVITLGEARVGTLPEKSCSFFSPGKKLTANECLVIMQMI